MFPQVTNRLFGLSFLMAVLLSSCSESRDHAAFVQLESEAKQALRENRFDDYLKSLGGDAALRLSALMLNEECFSSAAWGLTQLTFRASSQVQSKWVSSMWRPAYDDVIFSTGLEEAITSLSLFYPEGMSEFVKISDFVHNGMSWDEARIAAARLFGLTSLYYQERIRAGKEPLNLIFSDIPGRTRRVKTEKH